MLTKCKSFADAFIIQTCGNNRQLDIMQLRGARTAHVQQCSNRIASIQPSFLQELENKRIIYIFTDSKIY